jgi:hypothetical protein
MRPSETSLVGRVIAAVVERGTATLDDLVPLFPDVSRKKIHDALTNARSSKRLRVKVKGSFRAKRSSVWEPGQEKPAPRKKARPLEPVASVWEWADRGAWRHGAWPPLAQGRVIQKLEPWEAA